MRNYIIQGETLTGIADAIRAKAGSIDALTPEGMVTAIEGINTGFPNGTEWTQCLSVSVSQLTYDNGIWLCIPKSDNGLYYSTDGISWTLSNTDKKFRKVEYCNGLWVAGCSDGGLYYSNDGITWTQSIITSSSYPSPRQINNLWVCLVSEGYYYSTDGMVWTLNEVVLQNSYYADGMYVALSNTGEIFYSTDCINWTNSNVQLNAYSAIMNTNGVWIASGGTGGSVYRSTDGINWTQHSTPLEMVGPMFSCENMVFVSGNITGLGRPSAYSIDGGITWTTLDSVGASVQCVKKAKGLWVIGTQGNGLWHSSDGITWTQGNFATDESICENLEYANGVWVVSCGHFDQSYSFCCRPHYSFDGITWTPSNISATSDSAGIAINADGTWVLSHANKLYYSQTWSPNI